MRATRPPRRRTARRRPPPKRRRPDGDASARPGSHPPGRGRADPETPEAQKKEMVQNESRERRMLIRWGPRPACWAGALALALACVLPGHAAAARPLDEMAPNQARAVDHFTAAGPLADPPDGRLRGYGFSVVISQI